MLERRHWFGLQKGGSVWEHLVYTNMRLLAHLTFQDISEMPNGHHQLLTNKVAKIWSPHSKALLTSLDTQEMQTSDDTLQPKELFPLAPNSSTGASGPIDHRIEEYNYCTPLEKHLNNLMKEVEMKETEAMKLRC